MLPAYRTVKQPSEARLEINKSLFIAYVTPADTEETAAQFIEEIKKRHKEANHNCSAYVIGQHGQYQKADDNGEPSGTAGKPILEVLLKSGVKNAVIVVTRYFGGVLLGAGGLTRAYGRSAKDALDAAGISVVRPWTLAEVDCPYPLFERVRLEIPALGGVEGEHDFGALVTVRALLPEGAAEDFAARMQELSAGEFAPRIVGEEWKAVPRKRI